MSADAPVIDPETGEVHAPGTVLPERPTESQEVAELRGLLAQARIEVQDASQIILKQQREVSRLKNELEEQTAQADEMPMAKTIFKGWLRATGRNPKRTKFGPKRQKAVLARIREGRDFDLCMRVATVGALAANVSDRQKERYALLAALRAATGLLSEKQAEGVRKTYKETLGRGVEKFDDLELLFRDEVNFERAMANAERMDPEGTMTLLDVDV